MNLSCTAVSAACLGALASAPGLRQLSLLGCKLGDEGALVLVRALGGPPSTPANDVAADDQAPTGHFSDLEELIVSGCEIGIAGARALLQAVGAGAGRALRCLEMGGNPCAAECPEEVMGLVEGAAEARPEVMVHWRAMGGQPGEQ